jgi:hypothetical protein
MEKAEEKWNSMNLALKHGIQRWECSGQGDGRFLDKDAVVDEEEDVSDEEGGRGRRRGRMTAMTGLVTGLGT